MFAPPIVSGFLTVILIVAMLGVKRILPLDHPNHRSLHESPTPRTGGLAVMLGAGCGWALVQPPFEQLPTIALALALSAIHFFDDARGLSIALRFGIQVIASAVLVWLLPAVPGGMLGTALALVALVWMTNLYNFMDGSDGLAGGMAAFGFGFYSLAAYHDGFIAFAVQSACLAAASVGFLWFNFNPARIFMGDAGSIPIGFLAAATGIAGWQAKLWPLAFPVILFSPFIVDASVTLLKRFLTGEKFWQGHRDHYYQRLVRMGWGHRDTALLEYALMLACGISALLIQHSSTTRQISVVIAWASVYGYLLYSIDQAWKKQAGKIR